MRLLIRWILPIAVSFIFGYFSITKVVDVVQRAQRTDTAEQKLVTQAAQHELERKKLKENLAVVTENSNKRELRREHWRKSYYKTKREYNEYTKKWGSNPYPSDLD